MKNNYILRLAAALAIAFTISWAVWTVMIWHVREYSFTIRKNEGMFLKDTTTYDVILVGSSRMRQGINPNIFDSITGLRSYNLGVNGANIIEIKMVVDAYLLQHKKPAYIVLVPDFFIVSTEAVLCNHMSYITSMGSPPIDERLEETGIHTGLCKLLPFLKITGFNDSYRGLFLKVWRGRREIQPVDHVYKGYYGMNTSWSFKKYPVKQKDTRNMTARGRETFEALIALCRKQDIKLILAYTPEYKKEYQQNVLHFNTIMHYYDSVAIANQVPFFMDDSLPMCNDSTNFANTSHMNIKGGAIYSAIFAQQFNSVRNSR